MTRVSSRALLRTPFLEFHARSIFRGLSVHGLGAVFPDLDMISTKRTAAGGSSAPKAHQSLTQTLRTQKRQCRNMGMSCSASQLLARVWNSTRLPELLVTARTGVPGLRPNLQHAVDQSNEKPTLAQVESPTAAFHLMHNAGMRHAKKKWR